MKRKAMLFGLIINIIVQFAYTIVMGWIAFLLISIVGSFNADASPIAWIMIPLVLVLLASVIINIICATKWKKENEQFAKYKLLNIINIILNFISLASLVYMAITNPNYLIILIIAIALLVIGNALVISSLIAQKNVSN